MLLDAMSKLLIGLVLSRCAWGLLVSLIAVEQYLEKGR